MLRKIYPILKIYFKKLILAWNIVASSNTIK